MRLVQSTPQLVIRFPRHNFPVPSIRIAVFQLCDSAAEEIIDNLQLTDSRLERSIGSQQAFVRLRWFEVSVIQRGYRPRRWLI